MNRRTIIFFGIFLISILAVGANKGLCSFSEDQDPGEIKKMVEEQRLEGMLRYEQYKKQKELEEKNLPRQQPPATLGEKSQQEENNVKTPVTKIKTNQLDFGNSILFFILFSGILLGYLFYRLKGR